MIINTKFDIGQTVWFRHDENTIFASTIEAIATDIDKAGKTTIEYWSARTTSFHQSIFDECDVFLTKKEAENANS